MKLIVKTWKNTQKFCLIGYCLINVFAVNGQTNDIIKTRIENQNKQNQVKISFHPLVLNQIIKYKKRETLPETMRLAKFYFPLFEAKLKQYGLPEELKYLPIVESNLRSYATSKAGAQGLWQFMNGTGKELGLYETQNINLFNEPIASTDAACRYLKSLYQEFKDWELVLAAYNCGRGRVKRILKKTGKKDYWEIIKHLPKETQLYVPSFLAVIYLTNYSSYYELKPSDFVVEYRDVVIKSASKDLKVSALPFKTKKQKIIFTFLNPHLKTNHIPKKTYYYTTRSMFE
ncbi:lytic transglycosylase domain-containing protein [Ascidiimonas sp. W6]|uniref:lytic transglycosylase domain-containing protein n=1 Tax=Ascidiimonas meishanensis TaxID=3128903 RepID=UPI0030ECC308